MPKARVLQRRFLSSGARALFVASLLLFNLAFTSLSNAAAYAQVVNETEGVTTEEEVVETQEVVEAEETEETERTEDEENVETENTEELEAVAQNAPGEEENQVALAAVSEDFDFDFDCWVRTGLMEYSFFVDVENTTERNWAAGSADNQTDPAAYEAIVPTNFAAGDYSLEVTGWDGGEFTWYLDNGSEDEVISSDESFACEGQTLLDVIEDIDQLSTLADLLALSTEVNDCGDLAELISEDDEGPFTLFLPNNAAIANIVRSPVTSANELSELADHPDELCALLASHVVSGEFASSAVPAAGVTLPAYANDLDGLFAKATNGTVTVDGATVVLADQVASNGVIHVVNDVLLPQSVATINPVETDMTSPALSGSINMLSNNDIDDDLCVVVRIDGIPYNAQVSGLNWSIAEGEVMVNPTRSGTLFDIIVRDDCAVETDDDVNIEAAAFRVAALCDNCGSDLLGLTMARNVLSFPQPPEEPEEEPQVLGEQTPEPTETPVVYAAAGCGKGICGGKGGDVAQADDPSQIDTDGDGVVDSEDPDPLDPNVTGLEDEDGTDDEDASDQDGENGDGDDDGNNALLWFLAGGGIVAVWYLLWQRSGRES